MTIVGELATTREAGIVSGVARPVTVAPAMYVSGPTPGEKPSESVQTWGFVCTFFGIENGNVFAPKATCFPVTVFGSSTSQTLDGKGNPQYAGTSGSQSVARSGPPASPCPASTGVPDALASHPQARSARDPK